MADVIISGIAATLTVLADADLLEFEQGGVSKKGAASVTKAYILSELGDTDVDLSADSDSLFATQKATKAYVDAAVGGISDGDKGDITVDTDSNGTTWTIDNGVVTLAKMANLAQDQFIGRTTASTGVPQTATITAAARTVLDDTTVGAMRATLQVGQVCIAIACSDETTAITAGTNKAKFVNPYGSVFNVTAVVGSLSTAQTSGSIFTVDINEAGTSILSTKLTIDNTEKVGGSEAGAGSATPAVISDASLAAYAECEIDVDQVGDGTAKGLKVYILGYPS